MAKTTKNIMVRSTRVSTGRSAVDYLKSCQNYTLKKANLEDSKPNDYYFENGPLRL